MTEEDYNRNITCVYWDETLDSGFGDWSPEGCELSDTDVIDKAFCRCNHLTSFAMLMVISVHEHQPITTIT